MSRSVADGARADYLLRLADSSLILAQQLGAWVAHAPALEEDLALANVALDLLGEARLLLRYAGELEGRGRTEDELAFLRDPADYRNLGLVEQPNGDFGQTIVRQFLFDAYKKELLDELAHSSDARLAAIAAKAIKETRYHLRFSRGWLVRLGDGTSESHGRVADALDALWPHTAELFDADALDRAMAEQGVAPHPEKIEGGWRGAVGDAFREATLEVPARAAHRWYGKRGEHGEALGRLLAEMQFLQRAYPGAQW